MPVNAIQRNEAKRKSRKNYLMLAGAGAITGYTFKYILPLNSSEKNDEFFKSEIKSIDNQAEQTKLDYIKSIKKSATNNTAKLRLINLHETGKLNAEEIIKLKSPISKQVIDLYSEIIEEAERVKSKGKNALTAYTKEIRPGAAFTFIGLSIGVIGALFYDLSKKQKKNN